MENQEQNQYGRKRTNRSNVITRRDVPLGPLAPLYLAEAGAEEDFSDFYDKELRPLQDKVCTIIPENRGFSQ